MNIIFMVLTDLEIVFFNLLIYALLSTLRHNDLRHRLMMYTGCAVIISAYFFTTYMLLLPASITAALCMAVPSFLLFLFLSRYRGARFVLTFCFVDTISLIVAFIGRYLSLLGDLGAVSGFFVILLLYSAILILGRRFIQRFRALIKVEKAGWGYMAAATVVIYFAMIFFAAYPKPMVERPEYFLSWLVFAVIVVLCYMVFFQSIAKTQKIIEQNERLREEQRVYQLAYTDALTGLPNRAAYIERLNAMERERSGDSLCCIMLDCNNFKRINDQFGHAAGDCGLQSVAETLRQTFPQDGERLFRVGGDEFAALLRLSEEDVRQKLNILKAAVSAEGEKTNLPLSLAIGYAFPHDGESLESAFVRADQLMYADKNTGRQPSLKHAPAGETV